jgi:hypothetical protein
MRSDFESEWAIFKCRFGLSCLDKQEEAKAKDLFNLFREGMKAERERILKIIENRIYLIEPMDSFDRVDNAVCIARENELTELKKQIEGQKGSDGTLTPSGGK